MNDDALFLFLVGMLVYKALDLVSVKYKIEQSLVRINPVLRDWGADKVRVLRPLFRNLRRRNGGTTVRQLLWRAQVLKRIDWEFPILAMGMCLFVLFALGTTAAVAGVRHNSDLAKVVFAVATTMASATVSVAALCVEQFRLDLERARQ